MHGAQGLDALTPHGNTTLPCPLTRGKGWQAPKQGQNLGVGPSLGQLCSHTALLNYNIVESGGVSHREWV